MSSILVTVLAYNAAKLEGLWASRFLCGQSIDDVANLDWLIRVLNGEAKNQAVESVQAKIRTHFRIVMKGLLGLT